MHVKKFPVLNGPVTINALSSFYRVFEVKYSFEQKKKFHSFQTGLIFKKSKKNIFIAHGEGYLVLDTDDLYPKSLKPRLGDRFFTSSKKIENSFSTRIQYTPDGKVIKEI